MSQKSTDTAKWSGSGHFYVTGVDVDVLSMLLSDWIKKLQEDHNIKVTSYNYSFYCNGQEPVRKETIPTTEEK